MKQTDIAWNSPQPDNHPSTWQDSQGPRTLNIF